MQLHQQLVSRLGAHERNTEQFVCWNAPALPMEPSLSLDHGKYPFEVSGLNGLSRKTGVFQVEDLSGWPLQPIKWGEVFQRPVTSTHDCTRYLVMFLVSLIPAIDGKELVAGLVKAFELLGACSALIIRKAVDAVCMEPAVSLDEVVDRFRLVLKRIYAGGDAECLGRESDHLSVSGVRPHFAEGAETADFHESESSWCIRSGGYRGMRSRNFVFRTLERRNYF